MAILTLTVKYDPSEWPSDRLERQSELLKHAAVVAPDCRFPARHSETFSIEEGSRDRAITLIISDSAAVET